MLPGKQKNIPPRPKAEVQLCIVLRAEQAVGQRIAAGCRTPSRISRIIDRISHNCLHVTRETASNDDWLVVSTPLKNISQLGLLFPIHGKIKIVSNHQPDENLAVVAAPQAER